jgi:hypothetical protein
MALTNVGAPLTVGGALGKGSVKGTFGGVTSPVFIYEITPATIDPDGIAAAQAVSGAANLTINGALASAGAVTLDVPRSVQVASTSQTDTTQTATFTGTDTYGIALVETMTLNGTNAVLGLKAFKTVSRVAMSASTVGNVSAGSGDKFGVPYRINKFGSMQAFWDATWNSGSGTTTLAVTSTATATTGDVRGTYLPATASDGTRTLALWVYMDDVDSNNGLYGVDQYGG